MTGCGGLAVRGWALDLALLGLLAAGALAARLPHLQTIPAYTDEVVDMYRALLTAQGKIVPLTDTSSYIGSLWTWLQAAAFKVSGFSLEAPRFLVMLLGVATVLATYALGRAWSNRLGGLIAGGLMATAGSHVAVNSHIAYSNCITPLFTTLGTWAVFRAAGGRRQAGEERGSEGLPSPQPSPVRGGGGSSSAAWLLAAGLLWGLALQTHPSVLALLGGVGVFVLWRLRGSLWTRGPWLALALLVLVNSNLIVFNLISGFNSVEYAMQISGGRHTRNDPDLAVAYVPRLGRFGLGVLTGLGGGIDDRPRSSDFLQDPALWAVVVLAGLGVLWQLGRGNPLPALILVSMWLVMPLFTHRFDPLLDTRYITALFPVLFAAGAGLLADGVVDLERVAFNDGRATALVRLGQLGLLLGGGFLIWHPLLPLQLFYRQASKIGQTNDLFFQTLTTLEQSRRSGEPVLIDDRLGDLVFGLGVGKVNNGFRLALAAEGIPASFEDLSDNAWLAAANRCRSQLVVYATGRTGADDPLLNRLGLRTPDGAAGGAPGQGPGYAIYRLDPLPGTMGCG